jgi:hypothetical protein
VKYWCTYIYFGLYIAVVAHRGKPRVSPQAQYNARIIAWHTTYRACALLYHYVGANYLSVVACPILVLATVLGRLRLEEVKNDVKNSQGPPTLRENAIRKCDLGFLFFLNNHTSVCETLFGGGKLNSKQDSTYKKVQYLPRVRGLKSHNYSF